MLANQAGSLIQHGRIKTTLAKAKALRPIVEKLVTLGKKGGLHSRRLALSRLINNEDWVKKLFGEIAPRFQDRKGGYTRVLKLGLRNSDASSMALIEWVDHVLKAPEENSADTEEKKDEGKKAPEKKAAEAKAE
jgi:large subunit ribosomal protein L17